MNADGALLKECPSIPIHICMEIPSTKTSTYICIIHVHIYTVFW